MTRKIATNRVSDCVESHRYRMKSIFYRIVLSGIPLGAVVDSIFTRIFFLTWNEVAEQFGK